MGTDSGICVANAGDLDKIADADRIGATAAEDEDAFGRAGVGVRIRVFFLNEESVELIVELVVANNDGFDRDRGAGVDHRAVGQSLHAGREEAAIRTQHGTGAVVVVARCIVVHGHAVDDGRPEGGIDHAVIVRIDIAADRAAEIRHQQIRGAGVLESVVGEAAIGRAAGGAIGRLPGRACGPPVAVSGDDAAERHEAVDASGRGAGGCAGGIALDDQQRQCAEIDACDACDLDEFPVGAVGVDRQLVDELRRSGEWEGEEQCGAEKRHAMTEMHFDTPGQFDDASTVPGKCVRRVAVL